MENQKGFAGLALILVLVVLLAISGGIYIYQNKKAEAPGTVNIETQQVNQTQQTPPVASSASSQQILTSLIFNWGITASRIPPGFPSPDKVYGYPDVIQFIGNNSLIISYRNNSKPLFAVLKYDPNLQQFYYLDGLTASPFKVDEILWNRWRNRYGDTSFTPETYKFSSTPTSHPTPSDWKLTKENPFFSTQVDTSNWKIYKNSQYGFEVQYPPQLKPREQFDIPLGSGGSSPGVTFDYPAISNCDAPQGDCIHAFYLSFSPNLKSLYQFTGHTEIQWQDEGLTTVDGIAAEKFFSSAYTGGSTAYLIQSKNIAITFVGSDYSQISPSVLEKILSTFKFTEPTVSGTESEPFIYSITPSSGPIGTKVTIKGKNFNGFEGDLKARIATEFNPADYSSGIMYGETGSTASTIIATIKSSFCKQDNSYSGLPCASYFYVTPGVYEISVKPWSKESNSVSFTVTK